MPHHDTAVCEPESMVPTTIGLYGICAPGLKQGGAFRPTNEGRGLKFFAIDMRGGQNRFTYMSLDVDGAVKVSQRNSFGHGFLRKKMQEGNSLLFK